MQEGRCKGEAGKCNHRMQHAVLTISSVPELCTNKERFCKMQQEMVRCVEVELFPAMKNYITVPDELAREFVEWVDNICQDHLGQQCICGRLATRFEEQLK